MHINIKKIDKLRVWTCLQLFCDVFWILVCNCYDSERSGKTFLTLKVLKAFLFFSLPIFVLTIHIIPSDYNCN